jgi:hypothetical protein
MGDTDGSSISAWQLAAVIIPEFTLLSALSAAGSQALAQRGQRREPRDNVADADVMELSHCKLWQLLDRRPSATSSSAGNSELRDSRSR